MARLIRNTAILAKIESAYGTDAVPTGAANAILIANAQFEDNQDYVDRKLVRPYLGGSSQLIGARNLGISFEVELSGAGTAGTAPAWGPLLQACGFALDDQAAYVAYTPLSASFPSLTIYYCLDGVIRKALGCRGTAELDMSQGAKPALKFKFTGLAGGVAEAALPSATLTAFTPPVAITDPGAGDILLGCTLAAGALSGGAAYPSRGLSVNIGAGVQHIPLLGGESVDITDRGVTGSVTLDLTAAQEVSFDAAIGGGQLTSLGFEFGTVAGNIIAVYAPSVQRLRPKDNDTNGRLLAEIALRMLPVSGNDELTLIVK
ncbi:MAG: hypothetical protein HZC43_10125 [Nitrosomonadales bacterium]|nr:hypothetical protein [Nitrosomonadales bacterium]